MTRLRPHAKPTIQRITGQALVFAAGLALTVGSPALAVLLAQPTTAPQSQTTPPPPVRPPASGQPVTAQPTPPRQQQITASGAAQPRPDSKAPPAGTQPAPQPAPQPGAKPAEGLVRENAGAPHDAPGDMVELAAFSAPVELSALVDMLVKQLNINVAVKGNLSGQVSFNAPVAVPRERFLPLVRALLEQQGFTITYDNETSFYLVHPLNEMQVEFGGDSPTTRVIPTPNVRPSALKAAIDAQFGGGSATPGAGINPGGNPGGNSGISTGGAIGTAAYIDELGVIVVTASPRRLDLVEALVKRLLNEYARAQFIRFELKYVAASIARERALQLIGQAQQSSSRNFNNNNANMGGDPNAAPTTGKATTFDNLADRLTIDPQGNALIFRGVEDEIARVRLVLDTIDAPSGLISKSHYVGSAARQIADLARQRGLGEVTTIASTQNQNGNNQFRGFFNGDDGSNRQQRQTTVSAGGPVMVVDEDRGTIVYYATEEQQSLLEQLIKGMNLDDDLVVVKEYKLRFASAEDVAEIINGLLTNTAIASDSSLLPGSGSSGSSGSSGQRNLNNNNTRQTGQSNPTVILGPNFSNGSSAAGETGVGFASGPNVFVLADKANNQVLVKAPARQQKQFSALIERIDLRRPQVYINAKIVAVTAADDFHMAFETQVTNLFGEGIDINTAFGLSTLSNIGTAKTVSTGLSGLTAAVVKSSYVPIIINTLETTTDTRILSEPSLMVNDNEKATIERVDQQPTTTSNQGTATTTTSFAGYEDAGTNLDITPRISGNLVTLEIAAKLSAFEGQGSGGIPPPRNQASIDNKAVTVPSDMTVVIGGITLATRTDTVRKLPLLGDIPLLGYLFRDTTKNSRKTVLYIFITPRIVQDPNFEDLRLLTTGPQHETEVEPLLPKLKPVLVDFFVPQKIQEPPPASPPAPAGAEPQLTPQLVPQPAPNSAPRPPAEPPAQMPANAQPQFDPGNPSAISSRPR
ncbi:MAG: secretin N-terminal domain-containing protein [Phycisphaerales bacterium]|nr:hypothetical protein [Planctomycetota bacterium]